MIHHHQCVRWRGKKLIRFAAASVNIRLVTEISKKKEEEKKLKLICYSIKSIFLHHTHTHMYFLVADFAFLFFLLNLWLKI